MATQTEQIAASQQRQQIPVLWQLQFQTWSDGALLSLNEDETADIEVRSYAGWELDYRAAFGKTALPEKRAPKVDRTKWTLVGATKTLKEQYDAAPERTCDACGTTFKALKGPELCTPCWDAFRSISRERVTS